MSIVNKMSRFVVTGLFCGVLIASSTGLAAAKAKPDLPKLWYCAKAKARYVVPAVGDVEKILRRVRPGRLLTMDRISAFLQAHYKVDRACPMTTGIFAWILAHAADEFPICAGIFRHTLIASSWRPDS